MYCRPTYKFALKFCVCIEKRKSISGLCPWILIGDFAPGPHWGPGFHKARARCALRVFTLCARALTGHPTIPYPRAPASKVTPLSQMYRTWPMCLGLCLSSQVYSFQGSLKGESVVAAILSSRMEQSYCTSGFFRFQARFLTSSAPILTITHYLRTLFHPTRNLTHLPW